MIRQVGRGGCFEEEECREVADWRSEEKWIIKQLKTTAGSATLYFYGVWAVEASNQGNNPMFQCGTREGGAKVGLDSREKKVGRPFAVVKSELK